MSEARLADGVHIGLDESVYHAVDAISSHQLMTLARYPPDWAWDRASNALKEDDEPSGSVSAGLALGTAMHAYVLEGAAAFWDRYKTKAEPEAGLLKTVSDLQAFLGMSGVAFKKSASKGDLENLARDHGARLLSDWVDAQAGDGRIVITDAAINVIKLVDAQIKNHPDLKGLFEVGLPEVTVIWTAGGVRFKARIDLVGPNYILDLKSWSNAKVGEIQYGLLSEILSRRYHVQAAWYAHARRVMQRLASRPDRYVINHDGFLYDPAETLAKIETIRQGRQEAWIWLFAKTLRAPSIFVVLIDDVDDEAFKAGARECKRAILMFKAWQRACGPGPWFRPHVIVNPTWPDRVQWDRPVITPE